MCYRIRHTTVPHPQHALFAWPQHSRNHVGSAGPTWPFVTGCSSGFGKSLTAALIARGERAVVTARNVESIAKLRSDTVLPLQLDITDPDTVRAVVQEAIKTFGTIDALVNKSGYLQAIEVRLALTSHCTKDYLDNFSVNLVVPLYFMGSRSGWEGDFGAAPYNATKYALEGIFDIFQLELAKIAPAIRSMIVQPGQFRTNILNPGRFVFSRTHPGSVYDGVLKLALDELEKMSGQQPGNPDRAAERIIDEVKGEGITKGKPYPKRLPLGEDTIRAMRVNCKDISNICDEWGDVSRSTTFLGGWG
ncbi:short-chain oxidoreductase [Bimuria novae-zelandiae CBS 107.79]|uniref:Short-chain oxidoreductase n=1 Tax=Bimuria novae-zelandiae CBS 107.79 TaxID=1447943 RepID=A0A6A5UW44_9PLEO|nr:short-chain oxidoreductase [Bimuria novae-zelandiae CBS 107.79]